MAIGILEIQNLTNAYKASDTVIKAIDCELIHNKKALGGRLVTLVFEGSVSDLQTAFDLLQKQYEGTTLLKVAEVVSNPASQLMHYFKEGTFNEG